MRRHSHHVATWFYTYGKKMKTKNRSWHVRLLVTKWGNRLALRLPRESAKQLGVGEGDTLIGEIAPDGRLILSPVPHAVGNAEVRQMRRFLACQKVTMPVSPGMRRGARY